MGLNNQEKNTYVKKQLLQSLLLLMKEQDFDSISISQIASRANVGRASFYRNYHNKEEILKHELDRLSEKHNPLIETTNVDDSLVRLRMSKFIDFYREHSDFYFTLYKSGFENLILKSFIPENDISPNLPNAIAYYYSSLSYLKFGLIIEWIRRGMQETGDEFAVLMEKISKGEITDL